MLLNINQLTRHKYSNRLWFDSKLRDGIRQKLSLINSVLVQWNGKSSIEHINNFATYYLCIILTPYKIEKEAMLKIITYHSLPMKHSQTSNKPGYENWHSTILRVTIWKCCRPPKRHQKSLWIISLLFNLKMDWHFVRTHSPHGCATQNHPRPTTALDPSTHLMTNASWPAQCT